MSNLEGSDFEGFLFNEAADDRPSKAKYPKSPQKGRPGGKRQQTINMTTLEVTDSSTALGQSAQRRVIRHPSWRVYSVIYDLGVAPDIFGLKDTPVEILSVRPDSLTEALGALIKTVFIDKVPLEEVLADKAKYDPADIATCLETFLDIDGRHFLEAMLLANNSIDEICDVLGCDISYALTYSALFFDVKAFRNNVDRLTYVKLGTSGVDALNKNKAMSEGIEVLKTKLGVSPDRISTGMVLSDTFAKAYLKMLDLMDMNDLEYQESAQGWANIMIKIAQHLAKETGGNLQIADLAIKLVGTPPPAKGIGDLE